MFEDQSLNPQPFLPIFADGFLEDHARKIMSDPKIALVELVANCWDAGANNVEVSWPRSSVPGPIVIQDDGIGMTVEEFLHRWRQLNYNRRSVQGDEVIFPSDNQRSHRRVFGRNGKGRHSAFCFANTYLVETWRNGEANRFEIRRTTGVTSIPYEIVHRDADSKNGHGTMIRMTMGRNYMPVDMVRDLIGSKFITDPTFR